MDITTEERFNRGTPVPATGRMTAMVFLHVYGVIAKDRMKIGGFIPVFLDRIGTCICPIPQVPVAPGRERRVRGPQGRPIRGGRSGYGVGPPRPRHPGP